MAKVAILCLDDNKVNIADMGPDYVMEMLDHYKDDAYDVLALDINSSMIYVNKCNIVWIEVE